MKAGKVVLATSVILLLSLVTVFASAPNDFARVTTIDGINLDAQKIMIGDTTYNLHAGIAVRELRTQNLVSFSDLTVGTRVGCEVTEDGYVSEIWILPDGYEAIERND